MKYSYLYIIAGMLSMMACTEDTVYTPKKRSYPRVEYPDRNYIPFSMDECDFTFEHPAYAKVIPKTEFFGQDKTNSCWFDLAFTQLNGTLHCTYTPITNDTALFELIKDAYVLTNKHTARANYIDEQHIQGKNAEGIFFNVEGPSASRYQFFLTDSTSHFLKGSLYFNNSPYPDSMRVIENYIQEDIQKMITSFEFK